METRDDHQQRRPGRGRVGAFARDRNGVAAVEFALVALPFFFIVFAIIETALATTAGVVLNNAVGDAARQVMTGAVQKGDLDEAAFKKSICDDIGMLMSCDRLKLDMRTYPAGDPIPTDIKMDKGGIDGTRFCFDPGGQDTITVLKAYYEWPWATAFLGKLAEDTNGNLILASMSAFMNEPFGSSRNSKTNC